MPAAKQIYGAANAPNAFLSISFCLRFWSRAGCEIFGANLLDDEGLTGIFDKLIGVEEEKPLNAWEAGRINAALCMSIDKIAGSNFARLLRYYKTLGIMKAVKTKPSGICAFDEENLLPDSFRKVIEKECLPEAF